MVANISYGTPLLDCRLAYDATRRWHDSGLNSGEKKLAKIATNSLLAPETFFLLSSLVRRPVPPCNAAVPPRRAKARVFVMKVFVKKVSGDVFAELFVNIYLLRSTYF